MTDTPTLIDNIKNLFDKVEDKQDFYEKISHEFGIAASSARINWFTNFQIPNKYKLRENLILYMHNYISNQ